MHAAQGSRLNARAHPPACEGVVLPQVPPVGGEVRVLQGGQVEMVEEPLPGVYRGDTGDIFAWHGAQEELCCSTVNVFVTMIFGSLSGCPLGVSRATRSCSPPGRGTSRS